MRYLILPLLLLFAAPALATDDDLRSVVGMANHNRVVLVFAPSLSDSRLVAQRESMARLGLEAAERDMLLVQVAGAQVVGSHDDAAKLRRKFQVAPQAYRTLLIGRDGRIAQHADGPIDAARLIAAIDAMPMRQEEVRRAHAGLGKKTP
jgi:hypothetical protein